LKLTFKDSNGHWVKEVTIPEELWKEIIRRTYEGILRKLQAARTFLVTPGYENICAGLHTFAIEEYGKLLVLKDNSTPLTAGKIVIKYKQAFKSHSEKFNLALNTLPKECYILRQGSYTKRSFTKKSHVLDTEADLETRLTTFYTDINDSASPVNAPTVDRNSLSVAIDEMEKFVNNTSLP
jgi:AbiV family abortive infection protein